MTWHPMPALVCEKCGERMIACWGWNDHAQCLKLTHWYCSACSHDTKALGRERIYDRHQRKQA